jgi:hypothetical protein
MPYADPTRESPCGLPCRAASARKTKKRHLAKTPGVEGGGIVMLHVAARRGIRLSQKFNNAGRSIRLVKEVVFYDFNVTGVA